MKRNLVCALLCQVVIFGSVFILAAAQTMPPIGIIDVDGVAQRAGRKDSTCCKPTRPLPSASKVQILINNQGSGEIYYWLT